MVKESVANQRQAGGTHSGEKHIVFTNFSLFFISLFLLYCPYFFSSSSCPEHTSNPADPIILNQRESPNQPSHFLIINL